MSKWNKTETFVQLHFLCTDVLQKRSTLFWSLFWARFSADLRDPVRWFVLQAVGRQQGVDVVNNSTGCGVIALYDPGPVIDPDRTLQPETTFVKKKKE